MAYKTAYVVENNTITNAIIVDDEGEYSPELFGAIWINQEDVEIGMELDSDGLTWIWKHQAYTDEQIEEILRSLE